MAKEIKKLHIDFPGIKDFNIYKTAQASCINGKICDIWKETSRKSGSSKHTVYVQISEDKFASAYHDPCGWHVHTAESELFTVVEK